MGPWCVPVPSLTGSQVRAPFYNMWLILKRCDDGLLDSEVAAHIQGDHSIYFAGAPEDRSSRKDTNSKNMVTAICHPELSKALN